MEAVVSQLLEKDPERRFPNADLVARRLEAILAASGALPETVVIPPPSPTGAEPDRSPTALEVGGAHGSRPVPPVTQEAASDASRPGAARPELRPAASAVSLSTGRFVPVREEDLDQEPSAEEPHHVLVSLHTWLLAASLIAVGLAAWYFLHSPTADALYGKISVLIDNGAEDEAAESIQKFLTSFPNDPRKAALLGYAKEIELAQMERRLEHQAGNRLRSGNVLPVQRDYLEAVQYARLDPERGFKKFQALVDLYDQPGGRSGPTADYVALARRRLERLREQMDKQAAGYQAVLGDRLEEAQRLAGKDPARARAMWQATIELYAEKPWAAAMVAAARRALAEHPAAQKKLFPEIARPKKP
jgi:hypothetical protein